MRSGVNSVSGLSSGIDWKSLVDAMITADRASTRQFETRQKTFQSRLDGVRTLSSKLLAAQIDAANLKLASTFASRSVASSAASVLSGSASSSAVPGTYTVTAEQKAQAHQVATAGLASSSSAIGIGTVTIQVGNGAVSSIAVTAGNSSLEGLAAAINATTGIGVTAAVISDGSATPYRLVLTSKETGAANTIRFDASGLSGAGSAAFDKVVAADGNAYAGTATLHGAWNGAAFPSTIAVRVKAGGDGDQATAAFERSLDGGTTWSDAANAAGSIDLGNGLTLALSAGTFAAGDSFTVRPLQELTQAKDARVRYGSGPGAITITNGTNTINGLIPGVSLTVAGESATPVTLSVENDAKRAVETLTSVVKSVNEAIKYLKENGSYDAAKKTAGVLFSESDLKRSIDSVVRSLTQSVPGLPASMRDTTALGIGMDRGTGMLTLDSAKLVEKLAENPDAVRKLFNNSGSSTEAGIQFISLSDKTKVEDPFGLTITQVATQAKAGASALAATTVIGSGNRSLGLTINGRAYSVNLSEGTYTRAELADHLQRAVNAVAQRGDEIVVGIDGNGALDLRTRMYGSAQSLAVLATSATADLGLDVGTTNGTDVKGRINGGAELTGRGQVLTGGAGTSAEGLNLLITATAPVASATVTAIKGIGQLLGETLQAQTNVTTGTLVMKSNGLEKTVQSITDQIAKMDARLEQRRQRYLTQFQAMEKMINQYQAQGNFLSGQIKAFENAASARSKS